MARLDDLAITGIHRPPDGHVIQWSQGPRHLDMRHWSLLGYKCRKGESP